jgi:hypothetical protein
MLVQHVLSTQLLDAHSAMLLQRAPSALLPQLPVATSHTLPAMQSAFEVHIVLHMFVAGSQTKLPHDCVCPAGHVPIPSQVAALVSVEEPIGQDAARHAVLVPHLRQAPIPLHTPSLPQLDSGCAAQPPPSSALLFGMLVQVPTDCWTAQLRQTPVHSLLQQTLFTQKPDLHSSLSPQGTPSSLRPHIPISQRRVATHWALSVHEL